MTLKRTPLHALHVRLGARLVEFAGFEMPVMYAGILEEHEAVRSRVGLFDVSHMSNLWVLGPDAEATLSKAFVADASKIPVNGTKYTCALREDGTIVDDLYVFHTPHGYHVVPNAGMNEIVAEHVRKAGRAEVRDVTAETCILALQGPKAQATLEAFSGRSFENVKRFHLTQAPELGRDAFLSRTGYTGEDGFEIFCPASEGPRVFEGLLKAGEAHGIMPIGLGARDTLRLEKGYCLAGHEFAPRRIPGVDRPEQDSAGTRDDARSGGRTPLEAGLSWLVAWDHDFVGKAALERQKASGAHARLVGLKVTGRGIPREDQKVATPDGREVGVVSSGTLSPTLKEGIALAYVAPEHAKIGTELAILVREKPVAARVTKLPFV